MEATPTGVKPNGIIFNPSQTVLYLAISNDDSEQILFYDVAEDGILSTEREFVHAQILTVW